jgi:hypothetical protein
MRMTMTDDLAQYARALVGARIPELTVAELIAALTGPDAALPAEITGEVLDVLTAFENRLATLEEAVRREAEAGPQNRLSRSNKSATALVAIKGKSLRDSLRPPSRPLRAAANQN